MAGPIRHIVEIGSLPAEMSLASAQMMASFVKLLLDQAQQQAKLRDKFKKDEADN